MITPPIEDTTADKFIEALDKKLYNLREEIQFKGQA
jgi:hypothetical protein